MTEGVRLYAADADDLAVISALAQDMAIKAGEIGYDQRARRLVLIGNRYRWEEKRPSRVRAALRLEGVTALKRANWPEAADSVLALLAIRAEDDHVLINFSGGTALRAAIEAIDCELHDLSGPWGAKSRPKHKE